MPGFKWLVPMLMPLLLWLSCSKRITSERVLAVMLDTSPRRTTEQMGDPARQFVFMHREEQYRVMIYQASEQVTYNKEELSAFGDEEWRESPTSMSRCQGSSTFAHEFIFLFREDRLIHRGSLKELDRAPFALDTELKQTLRAHNRENRLHKRAEVRRPKRKASSFKR